MPRLPHGLAQQTVAVSDRYVLSLYATLHELGLYSIGASFAMGLKLFLNAFEYAWAPFYFAIMREPDAKPTYRLVATWGVAALVGLAMLVAAGAPQIVRIMTTPLFQGASGVMPWIAAGVALQGVYLLTSIGLNITKRTEFYPLATGLAAATSVGVNLAFVPRYGATGAAIANALSYAVLATASRRCSRTASTLWDTSGAGWRGWRAAGLAGYAVAVLPCPARGPPCPRCWRGRSWPARSISACSSMTGFPDRDRATASR